MFSGNARTQSWQPTRPVSVVIGFSPGSGNELSFRTVSHIVEKATGSRFIIENRPGADGVVAANHFIEQPANGYTIMVASQQGIFVVPELGNPGIPRFTNNSFDYVLTIARSPLAIIVPTSSKIVTPKDLVHAIETTQTPMTFAAGSGSHKLAYEYLVANTKANKINLQTVSYKGPAQAGLDVMGGHVSAGIIPAAVAQTMVNSGKVRFVSVLSEKRLTAIPDVPTMESTIPGLSVYAGWGIVLPKGSPPEVIKWYIDHFVPAIRSEQAQRFFRDNFMEVTEQELTPHGYQQGMDTLRKKWYPIALRMYTKSN